LGYDKSRANSCSSFTVACILALLPDISHLLRSFCHGPKILASIVETKFDGTLDSIS
jgi:hypothetical protein